MRGLFPLTSKQKTSDFFRNIRKWSCHFQKSQHSQDKNLTPIFQKKLAGILCCSRKYPYPSYGRFLKLNPPPHPSRHSILLSYFCSKNWAFDIPLPLGISVNLPWGGHGYFLELHNLHSRRYCKLIQWMSFCITSFGCPKIFWSQTTR